MAAAQVPAPFVGGFRTIDGNLLNRVLANPLYSRQDSLTAHAGGGQANALPLTATVNRITTVASANDSVKLPRSSQMSLCVVINDAASNALKLYGNGTATINNIATATGLVVPAGAMAILYSPVEGKWYASIGNTTNIAVTGPAPVPVGSSLTITAANAGGTFLLNTAAGSTATLPAATGTGNKYYFKVSTTITSNAHKILAASVSDFLNGRATGATAAGATLQFGSAATTNHSIQMPFAGSQPSGGIAGDAFTFTDIATNLWQVEGQYQAGTTATTPFSAATT